jgi:uncharacterized phage protein gp47/JayE
MSTLRSGQLFIPDSPAEIRDDQLTDFRLEAIAGGVLNPAVQPGTDNYFFFTATANCAYLQYANFGIIRPSITPLGAEGDDLEAWRKALSLPVVAATGASGKLTIGVAAGVTVTIPAGQQFVLPNGKRGEARPAALNVANGDDVSVVMVDKGSVTNTKAGVKVRFQNPPFNVATEARVSINSPLTGGYDVETEPRLRERILNRLGNTPGGGNWGHIREIAFNALATVQDCYVYPALGGPASQKSVIIREFDFANNDFTRAFSSAAVSIVENALHSNLPGEMQIKVQTVAEEDTDVAIELDLPDSSLAGGNGLGWTDQAPWPPAGSGPVAVSSVTSSTVFTVNAVTATSPIAGQTHVAWWSPQDQKFFTGLVTNVSGSSGAWVLTLAAPFVDSTGAIVTTGDYISPAASRLEAYRATFLRLMGGLGAGENVSTTESRRKRHPFVADGAPISITNAFLSQFIRAHAEIEDAEFVDITVPTPTIPVTIDDAPNVLVPRHFGIYVQAA